MPDLTPRELMLRTLRFEPTPRVPRNLWALPWADQHHPDALAMLRREYPDDITNPPVERPRLAHMRGNWHEEGVYVDEWGCEFLNICAGLIGEVKHPLVADYARDLDKVQPPTAHIDAGVEVIDPFCAKTDRFTVGFPGVNPFERLQWIRGTENLFVDLLERPAGYAELCRRVHDWNLAAIDRWLQTDLDAIGFADDWGTQRALLIRPDLWRELFKPIYREYVEHIHAAGKFAFMHSDGHITEILDDLIEIGVDAINSQLFCMDIEEIGRRFKGRITFWGEIDRQHVLPFGTEAEARAAVRRVANALYDGHGGVIAQFEFTAGCKPENAVAVYDEWARVGREYAARA